MTLDMRVLISNMEAARDRTNAQLAIIRRKIALRLERSPDEPFEETTETIAATQCGMLRQMGREFVALSRKLERQERAIALAIEKACLPQQVSA